MKKYDKAYTAWLLRCTLQHAKEVTSLVCVDHFKDFCIYGFFSHQLNIALGGSIGPHKNGGVAPQTVFTWSCYEGRNSIFSARYLATVLRNCSRNNNPTVKTSLRTTQSSAAAIATINSVRSNNSPYDRAATSHTALVGKHVHPLRRQREGDGNRSNVALLRRRRCSAWRPGRHHVSQIALPIHRISNHRRSSTERQLQQQLLDLRAAFRRRRERPTGRPFWRYYSIIARRTTTWSMTGARMKIITYRQLSNRVDRPPALRVRTTVSERAAGLWGTARRAAADGWCTSCRFVDISSDFDGFP